ncbi:Sister chromatid cohesion protein 2 [Tulasnella sp. 403]|nr:Sister chromatid cohesion protein 2 [Tulasnella sp. 403]
MPQTLPLPPPIHQRQSSEQPPPYSELPEPLAPLAAPRAPDPGTHQRQFWDHQQHRVNRLLEQERNIANVPTPPHSNYGGPNFRHNQHPSAPQTQQAGRSTQYMPYAPPRSWEPSSYEGSAFASSIVQSAPYASSSSYHHANPLPPRPSIRNLGSPIHYLHVHLILIPRNVQRMIYILAIRFNLIIMFLNNRSVTRLTRRYFNALHISYPLLSHVLKRHLSQHLKQRLNRHLSRQYAPEQSKVFFDDFLSRTAKDREMKESRLTKPLPKPVAARAGPSSNQAAASSTPVPPAASSTGLPRLPSAKFHIEVPPPSRPLHTPTKPAVRLPPEESPDPLAFGARQSKHAVQPSMVTPKKRKPEDSLTSPTAKRIQSVDRKHVPSSKPQSASSTVISPNTKMDLYVEVPELPKNWTPASATRITASKDGKGVMITPPSELRKYRGRAVSEFSEISKPGGGSDDELALGSVARPQQQRPSSKGSGIRTGERDDRGPLEKLIELLEDVFEAEDSLPTDADADNISADHLGHFFSRLTIDYNNPLLSCSIISKITKAIGKVARPAKRVRISARDAKIGNPAIAGLSELEMGTLSRVLKLLGRSVKLGEDLDPFAGPPVNTSVFVQETKPAKGKKKSAAKGKAAERARSKSKTPHPDGYEEPLDTSADVDMAGEGLDSVDEEELRKLERCLQMARESVVAADGCLALLSGDKLPKQAKLITGCLATIKNQFTKVVFPFAEVSSDVHGQASAILVYIVRENDELSQQCRGLVAEIFQSLSAVLPRINALISRTDLSMSESIIIQAVYIAIGPFFAVEFGADSKTSSKDKGALVLVCLGGAAALGGLRLSALSLIRSIFAYYPEQRSWIVEEILSSLIQLPDLKQKSGQYKLRDGHSIHTISALLLQLVQTSAHDVRMEGQRLAKARLMASQGNGFATSERTDALLSDKDREELAMYTTALDSPNAAAKSIIGFLTTRSGKGKITKSTKEADYRAIFDNLLQDLLTVLYRPEWPAASVLLAIATKYLVSALDDVKTAAAAAAETNGAKSIALDHLGIIGAKLRSCVLKQRQLNDGEEPLISLDEVLAKTDTQQLERLITAHGDVANHLIKRSSEDPAYDSARELTSAMWGQDLARVLGRCDSILSKMQDAVESNGESRRLWTLAVKIKSTMYDVWKDSPGDVFDVGTEAEITRLDAVSEELGGLQRLTQAYDTILNVILNSLGAPVVFMRTKGLRALGQIINADPSVLRRPNVRQAIEDHLHDQSPAVRDAAVELVGKYIVQSQELATDYYSIISDRIADTGLGVRKRIIKLLKMMYETSGNDQTRQVDICSKLVSRMSDDDDGVKDLAVKTLEELWFGDTTSASLSEGKAGARSTQEGMSNRWSAEDRAKSTAFVIMSVAGYFGDRQSPLEDLFHQIASSKEGKDASIVLGRYKDICGALIGSLVDAQSYPGFDLVSCVKTVHLLASAHPPMISISNARSLLPYLKNTTTEYKQKEDQNIADFILKIYCACIPHLPRTAIQFANELQATLALRIQKPSNPSVLPECIACFSSVVKHLTHDFVRVVGLMKSCNNRVQTIAKNPENVSPQNLRTLLVIVFMMSLLCEHCDFDALRTEHPDVASDIDSISTNPIIDHVYELLLTLYEGFTDTSARGQFLRCLGYLYRAQPTLMTRPQSAAMMDAVFESTDEEAKGRLLKIMQGFLIAESEKHAALQKAKRPKTAKPVNMEELVGNTDGFAESGVSSAIVQRYLPQILEAALHVQLRIQAVAVDILGFTIRQGLAHPLQCLPVIVALETSANSSLSARANALHAILYNKHASLVNSRFLECARKSFDYQSQIRKDVVQGYRLDPVPTALLHRWYSLVREKRNTRQDFLKGVLKTFDREPGGSSQDDVDFVRYIAENLSAFDYKTQEEVLTVIRHVTSVLSVTGMQILGAWAPKTQLMPNATDMPMDFAKPPSAQGSPPVDIPLARTSVIIGMLLLLKTHLKTSYALSEDKCSKWIPGKKSALGDKPAVRRKVDLVLSWERLPYAVKHIMIPDDAAQQRQRFLALWEEDGVQPEPDDTMEHEL